MLHIKDIEAFARINEALNADADTPVTEESATTIHPALLLAMVATGRLPMSALPKATEPTPAPTLFPWRRPGS